jgi:hypothetical protein
MYRCLSGLKRFHRLWSTRSEGKNMSEAMVEGKKDEKDIQLA